MDERTSQPEAEKWVPIAAGGHGSRERWPIAVVVGLFLIAAIPVIFGGVLRGRGAGDQLRYHEPTVLEFAEQWPSVDFSDYGSATTPGYHAALAMAAQLSDDRMFLRGVGTIFTIGLLATMAWACCRRFTAMQALACSLPLACSMYVFDAGVFLLPDNAGWWGVLAIVLLALRPRFDKWTLIGGGACLLATVLMRQIHIWAAAPLWTAAWLGSRGQHEESIVGLFKDLPSRMTRLGLAIVATAPAFAVLYYFYDMWGERLIPPSFEHWYQTGRLSWATAAFFLSLLGLGSVFFFPYLLVPLFGAFGKYRSKLFVIAGGVVLVGLVLAAIPPTTYSFEMGRFGGIWHAVEKAPVIGGHSSILVLAGSGFGALMLAAWAYAMPFRSRWVVLAAMVAFVVAQTASPQLWQRYQEPLILMLLAFMGCEVGGWRHTEEQAGTTPEERALIHWLETAGPFLLAVGFAVLTGTKLMGAKQLDPADEKFKIRMVDPTSGEVERVGERVGEGTEGGD